MILLFKKLNFLTIQITNFDEYSQRKFKMNQTFKICYQIKSY